MFFVFCIIILPTAVLLILLFATREKANDEMPPADPREVCALCQNDFPVNQLLEREIGTYGKVYCFCRQCIEKLHNEFQNQTAIKTGE